MSALPTRRSEHKFRHGKLKTTVGCWIRRRDLVGLFYWVVSRRRRRQVRRGEEEEAEDGVHGGADQILGGGIRKEQIPICCKKNRRTKWKRKYTNDVELLAQQYYSSMGILTPRPIFLGDRFFNYPGQPGLSSVPSVLPNVLPPPSTPPMMQPISRQCLPTYVTFPEQHHPTEGSPMMQLQNFGRHFESS